MRKWIIAASRQCLFLLSVVALSTTTARAQSQLEAFETQLDYTIRSACHGFMIDALPDFLSDARAWLNQSTPFCQTVRTLGKEESAYDLLKRQNPEVDYRNDPQYEIKYLSGYNEDLNRHNDCNDWMCEHIRDNAYDRGHPISLTDYKKVEQHCDGAYGCIESWFKSWPRPLPAATKTVQLSLDDLLTAQNAQAPQQPPAQIPNANTLPSGTGMSLDSLMGHTQPIPPPPTSRNLTASTTVAKNGGAELSLDNVFAGREQLALDQYLKKIRGYDGRLEHRCQCSLNNNGCYQLPDKSLLETANQKEQSRYGVCSQWSTQKSVMSVTSAEAKQQLATLAQLEKQLASLDKDMENTIQRWEKQRRADIARQQREAQERADSAYLAGMASILMQSGQVANGILSAEQAARNAVNVTRSVESGQSWGGAMSRNLTSAIPNYSQTAPNTAQTSSSTPNAQPQQPTYFVVCKTENQGTKVIGGCIGISPTSETRACSGASCGNNLQQVCQAVGRQIGTAFEYYASGHGSFKTAGQCVASCENDYGEKNWGQYGRKCLGLVSQ